MDKHKESSSNNNVDDIDRPFDRLPDDLVLRLLVDAAREDQHSAYAGFALLPLLCRFRTVCSRFDQIVPLVGSILWDLAKVPPLEPGGHRFLQECQSLKSLWIHADNDRFSDEVVSSIPPAFLVAILGAAPSLEAFEISGTVGFCEDNVDGHKTDELPEIFRTMALCRHLRSLKLNYLCNYQLRSAPLYRHPLSLLTQLQLNNVALEGSSVERIIKICPILEVLELNYIDQVETAVIASKSLKRLDISAISAFIRRLELRCPKLESLISDSILELSVDTPNLVELYLGDSRCKIIKQTQWKLKSVEVENSEGTEDSIWKILRFCGDARSVVIHEARDPDPGFGYEAGVKFSVLLRPFANLESLELPWDMFESIIVETEPSLLRSLSKLKSLQVGCTKLEEQMDLISLLVKSAPDLETLVVDCRHLKSPLTRVDVEQQLKKIGRKASQLNFVLDWPPWRR